MITLIPILFVSGILTVLLPCILPLIPIVLGTSVMGRSRWRPLMMVLGMLCSFVVFTFVLIVFLASIPAAAHIVRIATYDVLLLFGVTFVTGRPYARISGALFGSLFFLPNVAATIIAAVIGVVIMKRCTKATSFLQNIGSLLHMRTRNHIGEDHPLGAFLMGATLGLVWVPCTGPALSFVFALLHDKPGIEAIILLIAYGLGTAVPLLLIGYGGQFAVRSIHKLSSQSGRIKQVSGALLIFSAIGLQFGWFKVVETWLIQHTPLGTYAVELESEWFGEDIQGLRNVR